MTVAFAAPTPLAAHDQHARSVLADRYERAYRAVKQQLGHRAPGRDIVRYGLPDGHPADARTVRRSLAVLERMLHPIARPVAQSWWSAPTNSTPTIAVAVATPPASTATGSPLPACTWQPESGGNPNAVNSTSGAGGYYQIIPSTWAAYGGTGAPQDAPMSEQTQVAQRIWAAQGPSAWTNC